MIMIDVSLPPIVWIASYPKSGNTWMRYLLHCYLFGKPTKMAQVGMRSHQLEQYLEDGKRKEYFQENNDELVGALKDSIFERQEVIRKGWPTGVKEYVLMKSHFRYSDNHPLMSASDRVIVIYRNPKDVLLSAVNYFQLLGKLDEGEIENFVREFMERQGVKNFTARGYGNWSSHSKSWVTEASKKHKVLLVSYEDMLADTKHVFSQVLNFLEISPIQKRINQAVEHASFESVKNIELAQGKNDNISPDGAKGTGKRFFNKGTSGRRIIDVLGLDLDAEFDQAFNQSISHINKLVDSGLVRVAGSPTKLDCYADFSQQLVKDIAESGSKFSVS